MAGADVDGRVAGTDVDGRVAGTDVDGRVAGADVDGRVAIFRPNCLHDSGKSRFLLH